MVRSRHILAIALVAVCAFGSDAFSPSSRLSSTSLHRQISLNAISTDRRSFAATLGGVITVSSLQPPQSATAAEKWVYDNAKEVVVTSNYKPSIDDVMQLYGLGRSLDKLNAKVLDEAQRDDALAGLRAFNRDGNFYNVSKHCLVRQNLFLQTLSFSYILVRNSIHVYFLFQSLQS